MKFDARLFGFLNDLEGSSQNCHSWESKGPFPPPQEIAGLTKWFLRDHGR